MKTLTTYIISNNIYSDFNECLDDDLNIIDEGKLGDTIAKFLGVSNMDHKTYSDIWGKDKESKKDMATAQVISAAEKDSELKKIAEKTFNVIIDLGDGLEISKTVIMPAQSKQITSTPKANIYYRTNSTSTPSVKAVTSKPSSISFNTSGKLQYMFPETLGTPIFKQVSSVDGNWKYKETKKLSASSFTGTSNKINYKVYEVINATTGGGTWDISWS